MRFGIALIGAVLMAQDAPVIRVPVRMVAVPTLVFSKENRLIPGLKMGDFRVLDNGIPQTIHMDTDYTPVSVVIAIQTNQEGRALVPYIAKVGSVMEAHLVGATGRAAVVAYNRDFRVLKPFGSGDVGLAFRSLATHNNTTGTGAKMIDAGMRAIELLKDRKRTEARVLLYIGPVVDRGSAATWAELQQEAERENVSIYALNSAGGSEGQGTQDLGWLTSMLGHQDAKDPLSPLVVATGGTELHFHGQRELEDAIGTLGVELRSAYLLSYYPSSDDPGRHKISVEVSVPGAKTYARPGYFLSPN